MGNTDKILINTDKKPISADSREDVVLSYVRNNGSITNKEGCSLLNLKDSSVRKLFTAMVKAGVLSAVEENKNRRYILHNDHLGT